MKDSKAGGFGIRNIKWWRLLVRLGKMTKTNGAQMRRNALYISSIIVLAACQNEIESGSLKNDASDMGYAKIDTTNSPDQSRDTVLTDIIEDASPIDVLDQSDASTSQDLPDRPETIPVIVAFGWQGLTSVSIDEGINWCQTGLMTDPHDDLYRGGTFGEGLFVGAHAGESNRGAIITSTNGYEWKAQHRTNTDSTLPVNPSGQWYGGVQYGNGTWLAAGGCGQMATSVDGVNWVEIERFTDGCTHIRSLAFGAGKFVAGLDDLSWWESVDGQDWTQMDPDGGKVVVWNGSAFEGEIDGDSRWRGRGLCMWGSGWESNAKIFRSENIDCSDPVEVANPAHSVTTIAYGVAPAEDYLAENLPGELRTCLGL